MEIPTEPKLADFGLTEASYGAAQIRSHGYSQKAVSHENSAGCLLMIIGTAVGFSFSWLAAVPGMGVGALLGSAIGERLAKSVRTKAAADTECTRAFEYTNKLIDHEKQVKLYQFQLARKKREEEERAAAAAREIQAKIDVERQRQKEELMNKNDALGRCEQSFWSRLSPGEFEVQVAKLFRSQGFKAEVVGGSGDGGVDIRVSKDENEFTAIVQCKRYSAPAGPATVRDLYGTMLHAGVDCGYLVCLSGFTEGTRYFASTKSIILIEVYELCEIAAGRRRLMTD